MAITTKTDLAEQVRQFVRKDFHPRFGKLAEGFPSNVLWQRLRQLGTELWLDTGHIDDAAALWTRQFSALTTNNTLLNQEVQSGAYDELIGQAHQLLRDFGLDQRRLELEIAFILNSYHGLRLVERFDAYVSVEEHTLLAHDVNLAIDYGQRYYEICPERFVVKVPFTPAGLLATRRLEREEVPVNHTLGFSARQNYVVARIAQPHFVNVFLGRLNSFVADNNLGDGLYVGEKATLASQAAIRQLRTSQQLITRQIGASFRSGQQLFDLAGLDVFTMPPKVAKQFLESGHRPDEIQDRTQEDYRPVLAKGVRPEQIGLPTLWEISDRLIEAVDLLERENLDAFGPEDLVKFFAEHECGDFLPAWSEDQVLTSYTEGKSPKLENWREDLAAGKVGLDALMNLAGLSSFTADQKAMDDRVRDVLAKAGKRV